MAGFITEQILEKLLQNLVDAGKSHINYKDVISKLANLKARFLEREFHFDIDGVHTAICDALKDGKFGETYSTKLPVENNFI